MMSIKFQEFTTSFLWYFLIILALKLGQGNNSQSATNQKLIFSTFFFSPSFPQNAAATTTDPCQTSAIKRLANVGANRMCRANSATSVSPAFIHWRLTVCRVIAMQLAARVSFATTKPDGVNANQVWAVCSATSARTSTTGSVITGAKVRQRFYSSPVNSNDS